MVRLVIGNQTGVLESDNPKLMKALREKYTFRVPGAEFSTAYKKRRWDGKQAFFTPTGKFGSGLVYHIINDLEYIEEPYEIVDNRTEVDLQDFSIEGVEYRKYQQDAIEECLKYKNGIVLAPTGAGKTLVLAGLLKALEKETGLIFFTKKSLLKQTYDELTKLGFDVGVAFGDGVDIKPITLCTIQSVQKVVDTHLKTSTFIMFDEVQEFSKGKLATKAVKSFPNASYRFGFTATMPKESIAKLNIISYLGPTRDTADAVSLADMGYLTPPKIQVIKLNSEPDVADLDLTYPEVYDKYITNNKDRNDYIAGMVEKIRTKPSKTLIITKNLDHAKTLNELIPGSHLLMGENSLDERDEKVQEFLEEEASVLIGTVIFQTGINIPEITHLINARGLKSEVATLQAAGRALRRHDSKAQVFIYDFLDDAPYLLQHAKQRVKSYKSLGFDVYLIDENQEGRE